MKTSVSSTVVPPECELIVMIFDLKSYLYAFTTDDTLNLRLYSLFIQFRGTVIYPDENFARGKKMLFFPCQLSDCFLLDTCSSSILTVPSPTRIDAALQYRTSPSTNRRYGDTGCGHS